MRKQVSTNARFCYISALMLDCFRLTMGRATFFRPQTVVVNFLYLIVLFFKVFFNHSVVNLNNICLFHSIRKYLQETKHTQTHRQIYIERSRQTECTNTFQLYEESSKYYFQQLHSMQKKECD